jgi:hypothetical protein
VPSALSLSAPVKSRFERLADDLQRVMQARFVALVATGVSSSVAFVTAMEAGDLDACAALVHTWHREDLDTPLLMTTDEFARSLDTFPLEYQAIIDRHVVIAGTPPFAGAVVPIDRLRDACEVQAKGHVIHLRQGWMNASGHADQLADLIARSAAPLRALLTHVARLTVGHGEDADPALTGARAAGLPEDLIREILALEDAPERRRPLVDRLPDYLDASERLWSFVDNWRA